MDDMLGAMLDINEGVQEIIDWVMANGGWEKNALYVTADHDHYLTLHDNFPEVVAKHIILGETHNLTPENNSQKNPWSAAVEEGRAEDKSKGQADHIKEFTTWTAEDIEKVAHFWGAEGSGGNGWGSHSTRPVPLYSMGDDGCLEALKGSGYQVLGRKIPGVAGKVDQMHLHACMMKNLFGL
jgi:alkaline phosphatase